MRPPWPRAWRAPWVSSTPVRSTAALALRLASYDMLRTDVDAYGGDGEPVLILDDVFASLDEQRRRALAQMVAGAQQVLLTAAVDDDVPAELAGARYRVADGEVTRG